MKKLRSILITFIGISFFIWGCMLLSEQHPISGIIIIAIASAVLADMYINFKHSQSINYYKKHKENY